MSKKRIVVVCPGRGSYTSETLGYLKKYAAKYHDFIQNVDEMRAQRSEPTLTDLDSRERFSPALHTRGEHASSLIYACSYLDFLNIDKEKYEVVAVCGNSMGWYLTLAMAGALDEAAAFRVVQTMGSMMKEELIGGQIIYPIVNDETWFADRAREKSVFELLAKVKSGGHGQAHISIWLGGYVVIGGDKGGLDFMLKNLPKAGDYPFQLLNHAAFHTPLLYETSKKAQSELSPNLFQKPNLPMVDGRGHIWQPYSTDLEALYEYTLGHQVYAPYDFTASVTVALKEFMPDQLLLLGPGASLSGALGQILVKNKWQGFVNKNEFKARSKEILILAGVKNAE